MWRPSRRSKPRTKSEMIPDWGVRSPKSHVTCFSSHSGNFRPDVGARVSHFQEVRKDEEHVVQLETDVESLEGGKNPLPAAGQVHLGTAPAHRAFLKLSIEVGVGEDVRHANDIAPTAVEVVEDSVDRLNKPGRVDDDEFRQDRIVAEIYELASVVAVSEQGRKLTVEDVEAARDRDGLVVENAR